MPNYWLDADSLITTKNGPYGFDIAPSFWRFVEQKMNAGIVLSSSIVFNELENGDEDELFIWARQQKANGHFVEPDVAVQTVFRQIATYVTQHYPQYQAAEFLRGADAWVIAHAKAYGGRVVSFEVPAPNSNKPKIPDVAIRFDIQTINIYQMVRELGIVL
jgi:hypothetical protein